MFRPDTSIAARAASAHPRALRAQVDAWPRTVRVLPWSVAIFATMLFLTPFDSTSLPIELPAEARLDRVGVAAIGVLWICAIATGGSAAPRWRRVGLIGVALGLLVIAGYLSEVLNQQALANLGEDAAAFKRLVLLISYVVFFGLVVTIVRPTEVRAFATLLVVLGCVCALGVVYQFRTEVNVFYDWNRTLLGPFAVVGGAPTPEHDYDRATISGPTRHALAAATMLSLVLPLAIMKALGARSTAGRVWCVIAFGILIMGILGTVKRTAIILPAVGLLIIVLYRPRAMMRLAPLAAPMILLLPVVVPDAAGSTWNALFGDNQLVQASTEGRKADYVAVVPDVVAKTAFGRGLGSYQPTVYRYLDNQYLSYLIEIGAFGLAAFLLLLIGSAITAHQAQSASSAAARELGVALAAITALFAVSNFLFDSFSFPQSAYVFLLIAGLTLVAADGTVSVGRRTVARSLEAPEGVPPPRSARDRASELPAVSPTF